MDTRDALSPAHRVVYRGVWKRARVRRRVSKRSPLMLKMTFSCVRRRRGPSAGVAADVVQTSSSSSSSTAAERWTPAASTSSTAARSRTSDSTDAIWQSPRRVRDLLPQTRNTSTSHLLAYVYVSIHAGYSGRRCELTALSCVCMSVCPRSKRKWL